MKDQPKNKTILSPLFLLPRQVFLVFIKLYQLTFSPDHGLLKNRFPHGFCPFYPSCSSFAYQKIEKKGIFLGLPPAIWRIIRCHPWTKGGIDLP